MKKTNICRPITFYNKFMPLDERRHKCEYCAFGTVDGIDVGNNILRDEEKSITEQIWEEQKNFCSKLEGNFTAERIYAVAFEDSNEEEKFWDEEQEYQFFFFCRIQCANNKINAWENKDKIKALLSRENGVKAMLYLTYDNSDFLLVLRTESYELGAGLINSMHMNSDTKLQSHCRVKNTYTIFAVRYSWLATLKDEKRKKYDQQIIECVSIRVIQREPGTISKVISVLESTLEKLGISKKCFYCIPALGSDDNILIFNNIGWGSFLALYEEDQRTDPECTAFYNYAAGITTQFLIRYDDYDNKNKSGHFNPEFNRDKSYKGKIEELYKVFLSFDEELRKNELKEIYIVLNSLKKVDGNIFNDYAFFPILDSLSTMLYLLKNQSKQEGGLDKTELYEFLKQFSMYVQSSAISDKHARQVLNFNTKIYDIPIMLNTYYNAFLYNIKTVLNKDETKDYSFFVVPGMNDYLNVKELYKRVSDNKRLMSVQIPEYSAYEMHDMMIILTHETAHYVGTDYRNRDCRREYLLQSYAHAYIIYIRNADKIFHIFNKDVSDDTWEIIEERAYDLIKKAVLLQSNEEYIREDQKPQLRDSAMEKENIEIREKYDKHSYDINNFVRVAMLDLIVDAISNIFRPELYNLSEDEYKRVTELLMEANDRFMNCIKEKTTLCNSDMVMTGLISLYEECFADIVAIIILNMSAEDYLCTIIKNVVHQNLQFEKVISTSLRYRIIAILITVLSFGNEQSQSWKNEIKKNTDNEWILLGQNALDYWMNYIYFNNDKDPLKDFYQVLYAYRDKKIMDNLVEYLLICGGKLQDDIRDSNTVKSIRDSFNLKESVEDQIMDIEKVISDYKSKVLE